MADGRSGVVLDGYFAVVGEAGCKWILVVAMDDGVDGWDSPCSCLELGLVPSLNSLFTLPFRYREYPSLSLRSSVATCRFRVDRLGISDSSAGSRLGCSRPCWCR